MRAELSDADEPLPRIPPTRYGRGPPLPERQVERPPGGPRRGLEQDRIGAFERPTDGYTFLNASLGYRFFVGRTRILDLVLRGTNLTDEEGRNHVSFLKDMVPLPGRDFRLNARLAF